MSKTRREILTLMGGSAVGILFTPVPWRLITDTALLSENWPGIPRPARGEIKVKFTNCGLCPAGCAVRARCIGDQPVAMLPVTGHPLSGGALCPFGLTGHHLPYHPDRLKQGPVQAAAEAVGAAIAKRAPGEKVAVLDLRPGRAASWTYRRAMAALENGVYLAPAQPVAYDLSKARLVLSFGVPVLDGWGTPGNVLRARAGFRLVQVEAVESHTAALADEWLRIHPGSEASLALALAGLLSSKTAASLAPARAAEATGLTEKQIRDLATEMAGSSPALVLAACPEALALNRLTGAAGQAMVAREEAPVPESWKKAAPVAALASAPDNSIRVLLIDESAAGDYIPWTVIEKKLVRDNPVVLAFTPTGAGYARYAQFALPTAVYPEFVDEIPAAPDSPAPVFRLSASLVAPPSGLVNPSEFIAKAAGIPAGDALRERADAILKAGRGTLFTSADAKSTPVKDVKPDDFWKALGEGACWIGEAGKPAAPPDSFFSAAPAQAAGSEAASLPLLIAVTEERAAGLASPLMSKLYRESNLRLGPRRAALHPDTARSCGVSDGARAVLQTPLGKREMDILVDASVPPGVVAVAAEPEILDICGAPLRAQVVRA